MRMEDQLLFPDGDTDVELKLVSRLGQVSHLRRRGSDVRHEGCCISDPANGSSSKEVHSR